MSDRRETLKIIGAIGTTCAFPYSADELYGQQHDHAAGPQVTAKKPTFFDEIEFETVKSLSELIIPSGETPGAIAAGVPPYIDLVVSSQERWKKLFREGLAWMDSHASASYGKPFRQLSEEQQTALVTPLCEAADAIRAGASAAKEVEFFKAFKSMTADGYFTSKIGLVDTLGYKGNTVLGEYPTCTHEH